MKSSTGLLATIGLVACITAALQAQMAVCGGVNHLVTDPHEDFVLAGGTRLAAQFTPESPLSVQRVEWLFSSVTTETVLPNTTNYGAGAGIVEIRTTDPTTALPSDTILGTGNYVDALIGGGVIFFPVGGWHGADLPSPVVLSNGVPYWITFKVGPPVDAMAANPESFLAIDVAPTEPTPYTTLSPGSQTWQPVLVDQFFKFRVMSNDCNVTAPLGTVATIGSGCGGATLVSSGAPALGSPSFGIQIHTAAGVPAAVFLGVPAPRGGILLSLSCHLHLDPANIAPTPILSGITNSAGVLGIAAPVPLDVALVGAHFCLQAAAFVANGPVGVGQAGYGLVLTQAIDITLGY